METAITNNIPVEVAQKQDLTPEAMFDVWMERFYIHVPERTEFTVDPHLVLQRRVHDWYGLRKLIAEICPAVRERNEQWLTAFVSADEEVEV